MLHPAIDVAREPPTHPSSDGSALRRGVRIGSFSTSQRLIAMSAIPSKADMDQSAFDVGFGPIPELSDRLSFRKSGKFQAFLISRSMFWAERPDALFQIGKSHCGIETKRHLQ